MTMDELFQSLLDRRQRCIDTGLIHKWSPTGLLRNLTHEDQVKVSRRLEAGGELRYHAL